MSEKQSTEKDAREAVLGELVHGRGSAPDTGWFIVGEGGYWDVDNACWCVDQEGDAPWTTEWFDLCGLFVDLIAQAQRSWSAQGDDDE